VLLAGCQKFGGAGKEIRFSAVTVPEPLTKTAYSGELGSSGAERIDWSLDDVIRIYSDKATCNNAAAYHWADYSVSAITSSSQYSDAGTLTVTSATRGGLVWTDAVTHHFYGIYPVPGDDPAATVRGTSSTPFECSIPASQAGTASTFTAPIVSGASTTVYYPPMSNAFMVAHDSKSSGDITLQFEPAYTAFYISAGRKDKDITVHSVKLKSVNTALTGGFSVYYDTDDTKWVYTNMADISAGVNNEITFTFPPDLVLTTSNPTLDFVFFALPQEITGLSLDFNVTIDSDNVHRTLDLKAAKACTIQGRDYAPNDWIIFDGRKKSLISGLLVPGALWDAGITTVAMRGSVAEWGDESSSLEYGQHDPVVNATKLTYDTSDPLPASNYSFSIFAPKGQKWQIKVLDAVDGSVKTGVTITQDTNVGTGGVLTGTIGNPSKVDFTLSGAATGNVITFSIIVDDTTEYSIDSEVARNSNGCVIQ